ncbi:MAG: hypothetical protein AB1918_15905 [Pseudomonadota bacterium]
MASQTALQEIAAALNERQRAYLLAVYAEDQAREAAQRGPGGLPASRWRWIEYGPIGAKWLDGTAAWLLRRELERQGLVSQGTGATWAALVERGLVKTKQADTGIIDQHRRRILSLMIQMTTDGRKVARLVKGEPMTKPKAGAKPLSLSALRLIAYGQEHPTERFDYHAPWGMCPLDYLAALGICRGLIKRGLLGGEAPHDMRITDDGKAFDVTAEPNWKPLRRPRADVAFS